MTSAAFWIPFAISGACTIVLFYLLYRFYVLFNTNVPEVKVEALAIQPSKKNIVTCTGHRLLYQGHLKKSSKVITLFVPDFYGSIHDFDEILAKDMNSTHSMLVMSRRNLANPFRYRNIGVDINDIVDVITYLKNKYPSQKLRLVLEGYAAGLARRIVKKVGSFLEKVIIFNPITKNKNMSFAFKIKAMLFFSFWLGFHWEVELHMDYTAWTDNKNNKKTLEQISETKRSLLVLLQYNRLNKNILKKLAKVNQKIAVTIYQGTASLFYSETSFKEANQKNYLQSNQYQFWKDQKHFNMTGTIK